MRSRVTPRTRSTPPPMRGTSPAAHPKMRTRPGITSTSCISCAAGSSAKRTGSPGERRKEHTLTALDDKLAEQARIKAELRRMEENGETTEETDGDLRDTLVKRWKKFDEECAPIIARMREISEITRAAEDPVNREAGADSGGNGDGNVA